jgi:type II secretory pathway pseudopilin PulG
MFRLPVDFGSESARPVPIGCRTGPDVARRSSRHHPASLSEPGSGAARDPLHLGHSNFRIHLSKLPSAKSAFTLVEILVVLVLLSLIVFALMAVFSGTQRAFRAGLTYADTQQSGRTVMDMLSSDIASMTPANWTSNLTDPFVNNLAPVNFSVVEQTNAPTQPYPPMPLIQSLITSPSGAQVTNILENIFILEKGNLNGVPTWIGAGYSVNTNLADGTLYPLYRFYMTTNASAGPAGPVGIYNTYAGFQYANSNYWSHLMDGVVRLTAQAYDTNGVWMTNGYPNPINLGASFHFRNARFKPDPYNVIECFFYSNAVPASVQIELGTLEDRTLQHAESLNGVNQATYLTNAAGQVHIFRQRVWVRNLDPTAYQP